MSIKEKATNPLQYDLGEIIWGNEGHGLSPIRRLLIERLNPHLGEVAGKQTLDIGCGQGWLVQALQDRGANAQGIDSSKRNIAAARQQYPEANFKRDTLESYPAQGQFDLVTAIMVFEHVPDMPEGFKKVRSLLAPDGRFLLLEGDFDKFIKPRNGYTIDIEPIEPDELAVRTDYGERIGVMYDIFRTTDRTIRDATAAGLALTAHEPIPATDWLKAELPRYRQHGDDPLFQLYEFTAAS